MSKESLNAETQRLVGLANLRGSRTWVGSVPNLLNLSLNDSVPVFNTFTSIVHKQLNTHLSPQDSEGYPKHTIGKK